MRRRIKGSKSYIVSLSFDSRDRLTFVSCSDRVDSVLFLMIKGCFFV